MTVGLIEKGKVGGTCLHVGCIPTKALLHAAEIADAARDSDKFGVRATLEGVDVPAVIQYRESVVSSKHKGLQGLIKARGITTLNPASVPAWLRPHVEDGAEYGSDLLARFPDPCLARLVGDVADAHCVYRGLLALGAAGDVEALREARAWLREHRSALATLSGLAAENGAPVDDDRFYVTEGEPKP